MTIELRHFLLLTLIMLISFGVSAKLSTVDSLKLNIAHISGIDKVSSLLQIAEEISSSDLSSSVKFANEALNLAKTYNNDALIGQCYKELGGFYFNQVKYIKARNSFNNSIIYYQKAKDNNSIGHLYIKIAAIYSRKGILDSALIFDEKALKWSTEVHDTLNILRSLRSVGNTYYKMGQFENALKALSEAQIIANLFQDSQNELADIYNNLGILFSDWGKYKKSLSYYKKALSIEEQLGNSKKQARIFNNMGTIYFYQGNNDSALFFYLESLGKRNEINDINGKAFVLNNLGMYYGSQGEFSKSLEYFNESLYNFEKLSNRYGIVMTLYNIGSVHQEEKDFIPAKKHFNQGLKIAKQQGFTDYIVANYESLKDVYSEMGNWEKAYIALSHYNAINDSINDIQNIGLISEMEDKYEKERKEAELHIIKNQTQASKIEEDRTKILILGLIIILILILLSTFLLIRQIQTKTNLEYNKLNPALLRYQLNPQFISSSLDGIKELISKTRVKESSIFLAGLAKLIRVFVETSSSNVIILDKEMETLQAFLKLHQLRYDHELNFDLDIASHIETEMLAIPPFLFFPIYVLIIGNHLNKGIVNTKTKINTSGNYLIIETSFTYFIDQKSSLSDEADIKQRVERINERIILLNKTMKDKMLFNYKATNLQTLNSKNVLLRLEMPIKPV